MPKTTTLALLCIITMAIPAAAQNIDIFSGPSFTDPKKNDNNLSLSDRDNGIAIDLTGTNQQCNGMNGSYAAIRKLIMDNGGPENPVEWWVEKECGDIVRICIRTTKEACATYKSLGWSSARN